MSSWNRANVVSYNTHLTFIQDFVYITDKAYTDKEIIRMELRILNTLNFDLGRPLPLHFLRRASKAGGVEAATHTLAKYVVCLV